MTRFPMSIAYRRRLHRRHRGIGPGRSAPRDDGRQATAPEKHRGAARPVGGRSRHPGPGASRGQQSRGAGPSRRRAVAFPAASGAGLEQGRPSSACLPGRGWQRELSAKNSNLVEARTGIEPMYEDLQSSASPLCHRASRLVARAGGDRLHISHRPKQGQARRAPVRPAFPAPVDRPRSCSAAVCGHSACRRGRRPGNGRTAGCRCGG
jgi:hypothetical protein